MTAKVATISNGRTATRLQMTLLRFTDNLLRSTNATTVTIRKRKFTFLIILIALIGAIFAMAQVFGAGNTMNNDSSNTSGSASTPSDQQPASDHATGEQSNGNTHTSGSSASNTSSTSVTVNGQSVSVPQSGTYDKSIETPSGTVHVSGTTSQATTGNSVTNNSTTHVDINTDSGT